MKPGSVIVDLAAQNGGNCEYTVPNQVTTTANGVKVIGYTDLPGRLPTQSSQLYGTNLVNLLKLLCKEKDGNVTVDFDDVVVRGVTVSVKVKLPGLRRLFRFLLSLRRQRKRHLSQKNPPNRLLRGANTRSWRW